MSKAKSVEAELLGGEMDAEVFSLNQDIAGANVVQFSTSSPRDKFLKVRKVLEGPEAMAFLGLPNRPLSYLKQGDVSNISDKFDVLFKKWERSKKLDKTLGINVNAHFWARIKVRVWNKQNIERFEFDGGVPTGIVGQETAAVPSLGIEPGQYTGDLMDGTCLSTFLSEFPRSDRPKEYFVQIERVELTEDMLNHA